jgi:hypothetical protein
MRPATEGERIEAETAGLATPNRRPVARSAAHCVDVMLCVDHRGRSRVDGCRPPRRRHMLGRGEERGEDSSRPWPRG